MIRKEKIAWSMALLVLGISVYVQYASGYAGDKNWLLLAGRMWLDGKRLYIDIFEINPPLILWIYGFAAFLSRLSGFLEDFQVLALMGLAAVAFVIFLSVRIVACHPSFKNDLKKQAQLALLLAYTLIVWTNPVYFGDREHLFLIFTLPYILRWMPSVAREKPPLGLRVIIAGVAAIGYCMKPHAVIAFAGVQLIVILRERSARILFSIENLIIYVIAALYLGLVFRLAPDYIFTVLPMALATYSGYGHKLPGLGFLIVACFIFAVAFIDFRLRYTSPYRRDIYYFLGISFLYVIYALANNGWGYAYNPLISMLLITTGWVLWEFVYLKQDHLLRGLPYKQFGFGIRNCLINFSLSTIFILTAYFQAFTAVCGEGPVCKLHDKFLRVMKEDRARSFGTISTTFVFWPNLAKASDADLNTRFNHLWMLPEFFQAGPGFTRDHRWILEYVAGALASDLRVNKPDVVFVDNNQNFASGSMHVDLAAYFSAFPDFRDAWRNYHLEQSIVSCAHPEKTVCRFDVYRRNP